MPTVVESMCMRCHENGVTRLLLTKIPHFREVIVMAFECPHCHFRNSEIQSAGVIAEKGCAFTGQFSTKEDLNRQIVRGESSTISLPDLDLELPSSSKRGVLTTVEGLLSSITEDLGADQPVRKIMDPPTYEKIQGILDQIQAYLNLQVPFTITIDDPAGNSYIELLNEPPSMTDPKVSSRAYVRSPEQNAELGLAPPPSEEEKKKEEEEEPIKPDEVMCFPANCSACGHPGETRMKMINIPYFKEVVVMSTACEKCGYKSNEVKSGGAISKLGRKITLKIEDTEDLSRDILKSETCGLDLPEVDLQLQPGTLGGRFTTVEGLLKQVKEELEEKSPFSHGDSAAPETKATFAKFLGRLQDLLDLKVKGTLILDDPLANSYLQNLYAPDPDPSMTIEDYERTFDQNEELGLNDIKVEGYEEPEAASSSTEETA
ncbi:MAG: ZPR1 zinc-finger domain-containing protein [Piptocephalis tieghemiana]|nr:MAG: ZPR1 zinc-finger domain-containing protein [Piptocephalis tieghemiana]